MVAQESDADESAEEIETVIVTATRRETDIMDTPLLFLLLLMKS